MTLNELLETTRALELRLRSARVQTFFSSQPEDVRERFVSFRQEISVLEERLTNIQLERIAAKLKELSEDLNAGVANLQRALDRLNSTIAVLDTLSAVIGLVTRIVALV